ncbi:MULTISPECIES: TusE/DsrC/DsvC family sulfur relay protein [unclassified Marinobacterium]|jgi:tRNA 2-thiouridine synthesizing protein E|uniref:TusE/DsrC/DsvC family sulfur relay protein n=1 Tax=unclassified Marinobacterium TaxID=2644139 RepID=UPI001568EF4C|nr:MULTISPECIES: TusE/DsrC/DsvC family sulfur relay protein [unclassified Marinobacterium]NRP10544.1 Sulfurtransferase TusE [Marinobacterium sp. xm-g-48]NRP15799.1 Sulfurtransferase TusE [Marinobacterium sp. xm-a-152]NRP27609.1 Sulfurtransferase TusE [Marinobacterium sp. xm-d-420]NRP38807.1 Sulfurtransferase TusE [Marinobacterium sp. xm-a-121]NRP47853.1 Sulfurtransferase TusE [Marinobacterium sp. xm-d-543]
MSDLLVNGVSYPLDAEGYLENLTQWNVELAESFAESIDLELTEAHWELIDLMRQFYQEFELSPAMRPFIKYTTLHLGADKGKSIYLMQLFPGEGSPVKRIALIAGLPKPDNCL